MTTATRSIAAAAVNIGAFRTAVKNIAATIPAKNRPEIAARIRLTVNNDALTVSHRGFESYLAVTMPAENTTAGTAAFDGSYLNKSLATLLGGNSKTINEGSLELALEDEGLRTTFDGIDVTLEAVNDDKPEDEETSLGNPTPEHIATLATVTAANLHDAYKRIKHAASNDETLPMLCAANLTFGTKTITIHTTDRFRLAELEMPAEITDEAREHGSQLFSAIDFKHLDNVLPNDDTEVTISLAENGNRNTRYLRFDTASTTIIFTTVDADFPNVTPLWPRTVNHAVTVNRTDMKRAVAKMKKMNEGNRVFLTSTASGLEMRVNLAGGGTAKVDLDSTIVHTNDYGEFLFALNPDYLADAVAAFDTDMLTLAMTESARPVVILDGSHEINPHPEELRLPGDATHLELLMPVRLPS